MIMYLWNRYAPKWVIRVYRLQRTKSTGARKASWQKFIIIRHIKNCKMKYTWLVEKYLEGELQGKELSDFEILILKDPAVAEEVERIRKLNTFCIEQHSKLKSASV